MKYLQDDLELVERVARAIAVTLDPYGGPNPTWHYRGDARIAIAAMQPEMVTAHEAGRREGYAAGQAYMKEQAAECCDRLSYTPHTATATTAGVCARAIRAIPTSPGAATEAGHG